MRDSCKSLIPLNGCKGTTFSWFPQTFSDKKRAGGRKKDGGSDCAPEGAPFKSRLSCLQKPTFMPSKADFEASKSRL